MFDRVAARSLSFCRVLAVVVFALLGLPGNFGAAAAAEPSLEPRVRVGRATSPNGTLVHRDGPAAAWQVKQEGEGVSTRDVHMSLPGTRGAIDAADGGVRLELLGNLPAISDTPLLELAVVLHESRAYDLDFTLQRGRVILTNTKREGAVKVWVRFGDTAWDIQLPAKGDQVGLELASRWAPGTPFRREADPDHRPTRAALLHVLSGNAELRTGKTNHRLKAPPGPAYFQWDSLAGETEGPRRREEVPAWAAPDAGKKLPAALRAQIEQIAPSLDQETVEASLVRFLQSADRLTDEATARQRRELAVYALGAVDHVQALLGALAHPTHADVREAAILALRQWIGRDATQDFRLFRYLTRTADYSAAEAEALVQLLHSPFAADRPETFDTLIAYLRYARPEIRALARWHLYALAPAGKSIPYDSAASEEERKKAYDAWKKLVPSGKLPPAVKP